MRTLSSLILPALWLALPAAAQVAEATPAPPATKGGYVEPPPPTPISAEAEATLRQINAYRAAGANCGGQSMPPAPPLVWSAALQKAAEVQVARNARIGDVSHTGADGSSVGQRITAAGFEWRAAGENAAAGNDSVRGTLAQWMGSPGHCRNMMGADFQQVAVARKDNLSSTYRFYWIMVLGTPIR